MTLDSTGAATTALAAAGSGASQSESTAPGDVEPKLQADTFRCAPQRVLTLHVPSDLFTAIVLCLYNIGTQVKNGSFSSIYF